MPSIQLTIIQLESILQAAKQEIETNSEASKTVVIELINVNPYNVGGDEVKVLLKNIYFEKKPIIIY